MGQDLNIDHIKTNLS